MARKCAGLSAAARWLAARWPATTGLLAGYCAAAAGTLLAVVAHGTRHPAIALAVLACAAAIVSTRVPLPVAAACGAMAWVFYDGFIIGRHARLSWHGAASGRELAVCGGAALCAAALTRLAGRLARRLPGAAKQPAALTRPAGRRAAHRGAGLRSVSASAASRSGAAVINLAEARRRLSHSSADVS